MSPETLATNELGSTPASEVWSMGVTLYVLTTGRYPFASHDEIATAPVAWPSNTPLSQNFKSMVESMLHKEQEMRPTLRDIIEHAWMTNSHSQ